MKTMYGEAMFGRLYQLMSGLLCIPSSNADAKRGLSVPRKVHTDERSSLIQSSLIHLMSIKFNNHSCCHDTELSDELVTKCKKATSLSIANNDSIVF